MYTLVALVRLFILQSENVWACIQQNSEGQKSFSEQKPIIVHHKKSFTIKNLSEIFRVRRRSTTHDLRITTAGTIYLPGRDVILIVSVPSTNCRNDTHIRKARDERLNKCCKTCPVGKRVFRSHVAMLDHATTKRIHHVPVLYKNQLKITWQTVKNLQHIVTAKEQIGIIPPYRYEGPFQ